MLILYPSLENSTTPIAITYIDLNKHIRIQFNVQIKQLLKMINETKEVCLLENWVHDFSTNNEYSEQQLLLQDPYTVDICR